MRPTEESQRSHLFHASIIFMFHSTLIDVSVVTLSANSVESLVIFHLMAFNRHQKMESYEIQFFSVLINDNICTVLIV